MDPVNKKCYLFTVIYGEIGDTPAYCCTMGFVVADMSVFKLYSIFTGEKVRRYYNASTIHDITFLLTIDGDWITSEEREKTLYNNMHSKGSRGAAASRPIFESVGNAHAQPQIYLSVIVWTLDRKE